MKAIAVYPGKKDSVHLEDIAQPQLSNVKGGRGVLVKMLKVGVDATDREINEALYGNSPPGDKHLVLGHESFGIVQEVGPAVRRVKPGDYCSLTVRRPGGSIYDLIGTNDMTSEETYFERGINLLHGYLTEYVVEDEEYVVRVPKGLKHLGVLMEPMSIAAKAVQQAYEAQRRMRVWRPQRAFVMGVGQIGILCALILRLRGMEVYCFARSKRGSLNSQIIEALEATYVSTSERSLDDVVKEAGKPDLILEATGNSQIAFDCMRVLGLNGVLVLTSITGSDRKIEISSDKINLEWVLGNKMLFGTVNANREHFELGIRDLALGEVMFPGVLQRILTNPVQGLDNYRELMRLLVEEKSALKVFMNIAEE